jgi:hypothetical protein
VTYLISAKGAVSCQPGASPQESNTKDSQALKARVSSAAGFSIPEVNRAFSANIVSGVPRPLGRCPRLALHVAPLALNRYVVAAVRYFQNTPCDIFVAKTSHALCSSRRLWNYRSRGAGVLP